MFSEIFNSIFSVSIELSKATNQIFNWLNTPLKLGFNLPIFGFVGLSLASPLTLIATSIVALIVFWAIKSIVPLL